MTDDAIEREIHIHATIDHVWSLVSKTGFWIGDDLHFDVEAREGETVVIDTTAHGRFPIRVERLEAPRYAAYRSSGSPGEDPTATNSTLVEFTLIEQEDGVVVRLRESGFVNLPDTQASRDAQRDDNIAGWTQQLDRLRRVSEGAPAR